MTIEKRVCVLDILPLTRYFFSAHSLYSRVSHEGAADAFSDRCKVYFSEDLLLWISFNKKKNEQTTL